jgi:hypothetical protein
MLDLVFQPFIHPSFWKIITFRDAVGGFPSQPTASRKVLVCALLTSDPRLVSQIASTLVLFDLEVHERCDLGQQCAIVKVRPVRRFV